MESRMSRHKSDETNQKRSEKNKNLYNRIYEDAEYSNIESIANMEKTNEINLEMIKEMLSRNEKGEKKVTDEQIIEADSKIEEEPEYDIKKILDSAKTNRQETDERKKSLGDTNYNILKSLKIERKTKNKKTEELKDMIDSISNTSVLNQLNTQELSEKILSDLSSGSTNTMTNSVETPRLDKSFYTSGIHFRNEDFEEQKIKKKGGKKVGMIVLTLIIIVIIAFLFLIYKEYL